MKTEILLCFLLVSLLSFSRAVAGDSLVAWSQNILSDVRKGDWTRQCVPYLTALEYKIEQMDQTKPKKEELKKIAAPIMKNLWSIRIALHDQLSKADDACAIEIRNASRMFRFLEDFFGEIRFSPENMDPLKITFDQEKTPILESSPGYYLQKNGKNFELRPGDVMIARGVSFLSAVISRLGDVDSQFSHVILVTQNPETKAMETIESYVGKTVQVYDIGTALRYENARLLVLRPKDQALALRASTQMREFVMAHQKVDPIHYDYKLDFEDHTTMSCAEVAQVAFLNASDGEFNMPERPSTLTRGRNLLENLGIKSGKSFTPGDLESDSRFDIVGEWRDLRITRDSRLKDAILTKILTWMDNDGYVLEPSLQSKLAHGLIWDVRRTFVWPLFKFLGVEDFSREVPRNMVGTVALLTQLGNGMLNELRAWDSAYEQVTEISMTYLELYDHLEKMRARDEKVYADAKTRKKSIILKYLREPESTGVGLEMRYLDGF